MTIRQTFPVVALLIFAASALGQTVSGTVHDDNGSVLQSMVVAAYTTAGTLQANTTTDSSGRYSLLLPAGQYRLLAYDNAGTYATQFANDASSFEESPLISVANSQVVTVNFSLHRGITVTGTAFTSGGVRAGLIVAAYNLSGTKRGSTTTSGDSTFSIVLPPGNYKFVAYDDAGAFAPSFFRDETDFAEADIVTLVAGRQPVSVDFFLQLGGRLSGSVTDTTGRPIGNTSVLAYSSAGKFVSYTTTAANGTFSMTLPPGSYRFVAIDNSFTYAAGFLGDATSFESSPSVTLKAGQMRSDLAFHLDRGGLVTGSVIDATTGSGIGGITVAAYNIDGTLRTFVTTDASGHFALLLPNGSFRLAAFDVSLVYATQFYPQTASFSRAVSISSTIGQSITLQPFTLVHGGRISGTVTDQGTHSPVAGAVVVAYDLNGVAVAETKVSDTGIYRFVLPPGSYKLVAYDPQLRYAPAYSGQVASFDQATPVTVTAEGEKTSNFALPRGTQVSGSIVNSSGQPLSGIQVSLLDLDGNHVASATTAADGTFRLAAAPGSYKVLAFDPSGAHIATFLGGPTFPSAAVYVVDATGAPRLTVVMAGSARRRAVKH